MSHKWANEIKAWVDDPESVQCRNLDGVWSQIRAGLGLFDNPNYEFRIKPKKHTGWINIYSHHGSPQHPSKEAADRGAVAGRIACIQIEYEEGQGLT